MSPEQPIESHPRRGLAWPVVPMAMPFLYAWIAWSWWVEVRIQLDALPDAVAPAGVGAMAAAAVAARVPAVLSEGAVYHLWWRSRGLRLPYWRFTSWVAALSTVDVLGFSIRRAAEDAPEALRLVASALAGTGGAAPHANGASSAFGNFGILTLLRIGMTAWAQGRGLGARIGGPLIFTAAAWLLTRLIAWWSVDLLRGMSPIP